MKIKRYSKIIVNIFRVFGFDGVRIIIWLVFGRIYTNNVKKVYCKNLKRHIYVRAGSTDVILMVLMFCVDCDEDGRKEYGIDLGNREIKYIIDAGSNIGLFALLYQEKYPNAKIICIEPDRENFKVLKMNTEDNENIFAINKALWSKNVHLKIIDRRTGSWGFMVKELIDKKEWGGANTVVQAITLPDIIEEYQFPKIDILKLDIEGSEYKIFSENCGEWIEKVNIIFIETHDDIVLGCDQRTTDIMQTYGFAEQKRNGENRIFFKKA